MLYLFIVDLIFLPTIVQIGCLDINYLPSNLLVSTTRFCGTKLFSSKRSIMHICGNQSAWDITEFCNVSMDV